MTNHDINTVDPAADLESAMDFQIGEMFIPPMDHDLDCADIPFEDDGTYFDPMEPPMMCGDGSAPFVSSTASGFAQQLPHLEGGDKDKSVALYNHIVQHYHFVSDNKGRYYACRSGFKAVPVDSTEYDELLNSICVNELGMMMSSSTLTTVKDSLLPIIKTHSSPALVGIRSVYHNGVYYYRLNDTTVLQIAGGNFYSGVPADAGVYFAGSRTFQNQVMPDFDSPATLLPELVKAVFNVDPEEMLRYLAHLCCFFMPHISVPLLVLNGGHGTAKSTAAKMIMDLVDPSTVDVTAMPKDEQGLTALLAGKYIVGLDNIGKLSRKESDKLCIACTGGYDPQRQYYTNADLLSVPLKCNIILNGIGTLVTRPDLAERSNVIYFNRLKKRMTDSQVWEQFNAKMPKLLGSIFNTIRLGLPMVSTVLEGYTDLPRMAEFSTYGAAFIKAMGLDPIQFVKDYTASCSAFVGDCAEMDDLYLLVKAFVTDRGGFYQEPAKTLLADLNNYAECKHKLIDKMTPSTLSRALNDAEDDLRRMGVSVTIKHDTPKSITLQLPTAAAQPTAAPVGNEN